MELLKQCGPQNAQVLADELGVSAMAVRQHIYQLQEEKLVTFEEQPRPIGRPAKLWQLTAAADRYFPDAHAALAVDLVASLTETFGKTGLDKLIAARARQQVDDYLTHMPRRASLRRRLEKLAELRTAEGYMAEVIEQDDDTLLLVENHCPICAAASACNRLCAAELDVFQATLGADIEIQRTEHIMDGSRRCAYEVRKRPKK